MATSTKLPVGSWRAQVRCKGRYVNESFLLRKTLKNGLSKLNVVSTAANQSWRAAHATRRFSAISSNFIATIFGVGERIGRSRAASLAFLEGRLGRLRSCDQNRQSNSSPYRL